MAAPTARTAEDLKRAVETWLQFGELSIVSKRQSALHFAYGKRTRTDVEHPWMVTMTMSDAEVEGRLSSFGKLVGQLVLGFQKRDAPMHIQRRMQKPPRPWSTTGRKEVEPSFRGGYSTQHYQPYDPRRPYNAPSDRTGGGNSRSSGGGSG